MKHKNIKYLVIIFAGIFLWSCKKELNVFPTTSEVDGNVIVDVNSAATVLNGVYYQFADAQNNYNVQTIEWTNVNEIFPSEMAGSLTNAAYDDQIYSLTITPNTFGGDYIWDYGYKLVNAANGFIKNVTPVAKIPAATKKQMLAEAKFLRAFGNSELLLYYGQYYDPTSKYGIILRDEFVNTDNINVARSGVAAAYTSILADCDTAIAGLPATNTQTYYANASAAKLLKARVLINRGLAGDYAEVISLTNDVITNGPFALEDSVKNIFLTQGFNSKEVILGVQPFALQTFKCQQNQFIGNYPVSDGFVNLLQNDPRNQWVYRNDDGGTAYGSVYGSINELAKYYSGSTAIPVQTALAEYCYAFRLTEAYLLEAEAITLSNGDLGTAKTLLKTIKSHAGITDFTDVNNTNTAAALQVLVVKEEIKNFVAENGADWFALRRLPFTTAQTIQPALKSVNQLILPIPSSEISVNSLVVQNPE